MKCDHFRGWGGEVMYFGTQTHFIELFGSSTIYSVKTVKESEVASIRDVSILLCVFTFQGVE